MERRTHNNQIEEMYTMLQNGLKEIRTELSLHIKEEEKDLSDLRDIKKVLFGNPVTQEPGMVEMVNDIHNILTQARGVGNFFGGVKGMLGLMISLGAAIVLLKGWLK